MSKETFYYLCEKFRPVIEQQNTKMRLAICVEHRFAITLWCLATCEYRTTVCVIVQRVVISNQLEVKEGY